MAELLRDYSGQFRPDARLRDFTEEALKAWQSAAGGEYSGIDGFWQGLTTEEVGESKSLEWTQELWKRHITEEPRFIAEALHIKMGNGNVADVFKCFQFDPYAAGIMPERNWTLKDYNHGTMEVVRCKALEYMEKAKYSEERITFLCRTIDGEQIEGYAKQINPNIKMKVLFMPPRKPTDKIACLNEFDLEEPISVRESGAEILTGDYSGEYRLDKRFHDFPEETLVRLMSAWGKQSMCLDGQWYQLMCEILGEEKALKLEREVWRRFNPKRPMWIRNALNIKGNDVAAVFKAWQFDPMGRGICPDAQMDLKNNNHGVITAKRCLPLEYFERHSYSPENIEHLFRVVAREVMEGFAREFNPAIKTKFLFAPPRKTSDKLALQIELKLEG